MIRLFRRLRAKLAKIDSIDRRLELVQAALGRIEGRQLHGNAAARLADFEYRVHSQGGEDGIIQHLIRHVKVSKPVFVEFGVEDYSESNTRYLLTHNNWSGLVMDSSQANVDRIKQSDIYWRHSLTAIPAFVTKENINDLLVGNGMAGEIGLLSVDIDGNDYWVWEAITAVTPSIVIVEYNSRYGSDVSVAIPYDPAFDRAKAHYSMIYFGASLRAFCRLGARKGYVFVGCNSAGSNAFFVRRELLSPEVREATIEEGYVEAKFRQSCDRRGQLCFLSAAEESRILMNLPTVTIEK